MLVLYRPHALTCPFLTLDCIVPMRFTKVCPSATTQGAFRRQKGYRLAPAVHTCFLAGSACMFMWNFLCRQAPSTTLIVEAYLYQCQLIKEARRRMFFQNKFTACSEHRDFQAVRTCLDDARNLSESGIRNIKASDFERLRFAAFFFFPSCGRAGSKQALSLKHR